MALQKEQYLAHRREILQYFSEQLGTYVAKEGKPAGFAESLITSYPYFKDLAEMGIDPHALFDKHLENDNAEADYQRWKSGSTATVTTNMSMTIPRVEDMVRGKSHKVIDRVPTETLKPKA